MKTMKALGVAVVLAVLGVIIGGSATPSVVLAAASETCFFKSESTSGMNKTCVYNCVSGDASITIKSVQLCPLNIKR